MSTALDPRLADGATLCSVCGHTFPHPWEQLACAVPCAVCGAVPWCRLTRQDGCVVVEPVPGRTPDAEEIDWLVETHVRWSERQNVVCDLAALDLLESALVARLVLLHRRVKSTQHRLLLRGVGPLAREELAILNLDRVLELGGDKPDAARRFESAASP